MWFLNFVVATSLIGNTVTEQRDGWIGIHWNSLSHVIGDVYAHSPAERAGLRHGDRLIHAYEFNKKPVVGSIVQLTIERGNQEFTVLMERVARTELDLKHFIKRETP